MTTDHCGRISADAVVGRTALWDGPMKESFSCWHSHEGADTHATGGLACDGHLIRITAERRDVFLHPLEGCDLVEHADIA